MITPNQIIAALNDIQEFCENQLSCDRCPMWTLGQYHCLIKDIMRPHLGFDPCDWEIVSPEYFD